MAEIQRVNPSHKPCPECGSGQYEELPGGLVLQSVSTDPYGKQKLSDYGVQVSGLICGKCGYVRLFAVRK